MMSLNALIRLSRILQRVVQIIRYASIENSFIKMCLYYVIKTNKFVPYDDVYTTYISLSFKVL